MQNRFEADSIRKSFGNQQILTDIYLSCQTGEIIGLLGRNGSGKSTLLKILFGTLHTDYKHIMINGEYLNQPFRKKGLISYLNQDNFIPINMTVRKVIRLYQTQLNEVDLYSDPIISSLLDSKISNLSGGELRYIEIILTLNLNSKFAFLDEPFNGLAPIHIDIVKNVIRNQSKFKGIILTDHDYRNVLDIATKYLVLVDGGLKVLESQDEFVTWGYLPEKQN